ncbi:MAG TPA: hypothetical protein VGF24_32940 [Vicinamibacterales bacterium]|jgi:hypothetical protein
MSGQKRTFLTLVGVALLATGIVAEQAKQAKQAAAKPTAATKKPNDEGATTAPSKLVAPVRGEAELGYTKPAQKNDGKFLITTMKVKNLSSGAIAGLKIDEFWYDKDGNPVTGSQPFRYRKPLQPGEVIEVTLKVQVVPAMKTGRNQYKFEHANGKIKPTLLPKL